MKFGPNVCNYYWCDERPTVKVERIFKHGERDVRYYCEEHYRMLYEDEALSYLRNLFCSKVVVTKIKTKRGGAFSDVSTAE